MACAIKKEIFTAAPAAEITASGRLKMTPLAPSKMTCMPTIYWRCAAADACADQRRRKEQAALKAPMTARHAVDINIKAFFRTHVRLALILAFSISIRDIII